MLEQWRPEVKEVFDDVIYPYYSNIDNHVKKEAQDLLKRLQSKRVNAHVGGIQVIGESYVDHPQEFAEAMIEEVNDIWQTTGWKVEHNSKNLCVESKPVIGVFESSGILMTRAEGVVNTSASKLFNLLTSPEGFAIIDPVSSPEDHKKPPLESYQWKEEARLEAALATTKLPMMPMCDFVVLNAIDPERFIFASKSILHNDCKGGSKYSGLDQEAERIRALNTFAIQVEYIDEDKCRLKSINYADMAGKTSAGMNNFVNTKIFFRLLFNRINKAI